MFRFAGTLFVFILIFYLLLFDNFSKTNSKPVINNEMTYWLQLSRKSNIEYLYFGIPGQKFNSFVVKIFKVKTGAEKQKPTPLPKLLGRDYWLITEKFDSRANPETSPFFLKLNIPISESEPFGPVPYLECDGQCNWVLPGYFGLHGINGDLSRLSKENLGSSGCIRHTDQDITYLYHILDLKNEIRYYIEDI